MSDDEDTSNRSARSNDSDEEMEEPADEELMQFLTQKLRLSAAAAEAIVEQGLTAFDDFIELTDKDIDGLCDRVRSPGGMLERPRGGPVADRGVKIGLIQQKNLRAARFYIYHCHRIQRTFNYRAVTLKEMRTFWSQRFEDEKDSTKADSSEDDLKPLKNETEIKKALEDLDAVLLNRLGAGGSPLAYVVRKVVSLPEATSGEEDPGMGKPSIKEELIRRTRHDGTHYDKDNEKVWNIIRGWGHKSPAWNWISSFASKRDGRGAYLALITHYFGASYTSKTISDANADLKTLQYTGRQKNFTFDTFCGKLNKAFTDLEEAGEGISNRLKVQHLIEAIHDPQLEPAKMHILSDDKYKKDYFGTVSYLKECLNAYSNSNKTNPNRSVSVANRGGDRGGKRGGYRGGSKGGYKGKKGRFTKHGKGGGNREKPAEKYDPANPAKSLSSKAWAKLDDDTKNLIREARNDEQRKRNVSATNRRQEESKEEASDDDSSSDGERSRDHFRPGDKPARKKPKKI